MKYSIYLDNAATTAIEEEVLDAMYPYLTTAYGNPSSLHALGRGTRHGMETARNSIAAHLGVKPSSICFTSGGTESNNMAIAAALRDLHCDHIITSRLEHHSVLNAIDYYAELFKTSISYVAVHEDGTVDHNDLKKMLTEQHARGKKCLVSLMHANNETGMFTEIRWVGALCKKFGAVFHSDCVQTIGHCSLNLSRTGVHLASGSAHKFGGPKGVGILYIQEGLSIRPLIYGGAQERGLRAGTENVAGAVGFAKALELAVKNYPEDYLYISELKHYLVSLLKNEGEGVVINSGRFSLYTILSVSFPKTSRSEGLLLQLDQSGICVSGGAACSGGGSHVIEALGKGQEWVTLRFSFSKWNAKKELDKVVYCIRQALEEKPLVEKINCQR
jgi:cysteine desulfurase